MSALLAMGCSSPPAPGVVEVDAATAVDTVAVDASPTDTPVAMPDRSQPDVVADPSCGDAGELQNMCNGQCVSLQSNLMHCGSCGRACTAPGNGRATCGAGVCGFICDTGFTACGAACINTQTDMANCGACGIPCGAGRVCLAGSCVCPGAGQISCGTGSAQTCVDAQNDTSNCGACGNACSMGQLCRMGACTCTAMGLMRCGSACVDTSSDAANCGACGTACPTGQVCAASRCGCPTGRTLCDGTCVDLTADTRNCGACGTSCSTTATGASASCIASACVVSCDGGRRWTGRECVAIVAPRPIAPLTPFVVSSLRPTLRWDFGTGNDGARVEICENRMCSGTPVDAFNVVGSSGRVRTALMPRRPYWWRLLGRAGDATGTAYGPIWMFQTPARDLGTDTTLMPTHRDINGDGYDDLAVSTNNLRVEVLFGGPDGLRTSSTDRVMIDAPTNAGGVFGSVQMGDVNADGLADLIIASRTDIYVYHGSASTPSLPRTPSTTTPISSTGANFGYAAVGDIDSDGDDDVVVGSWSAGMVVVLGSRDGLDRASTTPISRLSQTPFGNNAFFVPDMDGDGWSEVLISTPCAHQPDACTGARGEAWLFRGTRTGLNTTTLAASGYGTDSPPTDSRFGFDALGADFDGDGYGDLYIGSVGVGAYFYRGGTSLPPMRSAVIPGRRYGFAAGDYDLDGAQDLVLSRGDTPITGTAVFLRQTGGNQTASRTISAPDGGNFGGFATSSDFNGDGILDVVIAANEAFSGQGRLYVFHGARGAGLGTSATQLINPVGAMTVNFGTGLR